MDSDSVLSDHKLHALNNYVYVNNYSGVAGAWERGLVEKKITEGESEKEISENIVNGHVCQVKIKCKLFILLAVTTIVTVIKFRLW